MKRGERRGKDGRRLTHVAGDGTASMVDVSAKPDTARIGFTPTRSAAVNVAPR